MGKSAGFLLALGVAAGVPLALLLPPFLIWMSPFLVLGLGLGALAWLALRAATRGGVRRARVLTVRGLGREQALRTRLRDALEGALALAPAGEAPFACACVKRCAGGGCRAVVRLRTAQGSALLEVPGTTAVEVAVRSAELLEEGQRQGVFPMLSGRDPEDAPACTRETCPLGTRSIFYRPTPAARAETSRQAA